MTTESTARPSDGSVRTPSVPGEYQLPVHFGVVVLCTITLPLVLWFIYPKAPQNGWGWDLLMGTGMLGAGMMLALPLVAPRVWVYYGGDAQALRSLLNLHRDVNYAVLVLVLIHIVGLVVIDRTTIEYLKLSAPLSMLAATVASLLLLVITLTSRYRTALRLRYPSWHAWHVGMSVLAMTFMAFHIVDAGYYVNSPVKKAVFIVLVAGPSLVTFGLSRWHRKFGSATWRGLDSRSQPVLQLPATRGFSVRLVVLLGVFWLLWMICFSIPDGGSRGDAQVTLCRASECE